MAKLEKLLNVFLTFALWFASRVSKEKKK